ncbi:MAG: hypothetical protein KDC27_11815 [Acidobacteria bacterium]|nr:hypothetical protein [Acidobacteriota bacterium]
MKLNWMKDEWGRTARAAGWLTLSVTRAGEKWIACVAGMPVQRMYGQKNPETTEFDDADAACQAAEECAVRLCDAALDALA